MRPTTRFNMIASFLLLTSASMLISAISRADDEKIEFKTSGFGSLYYGQAFSKDTTPYGFSASSASVNTQADFTHFSLVGMDLSAKFNNQWAVAAELVATGADAATTNYQAFAQWAYISYKPMDDTTLRVGRQRFPIFTASEFVNAHNELPYREIPAIVYRTMPFSTFDGAGASQNFDLGFGKLSAGIFGGTPLLDETLPAYFSFTASSMFGAKLTLDGDGWRVRVQGSTYNAGIDANLALVNPNLTETVVSGTTKVISGGYRYDKNNIVSWGEYVAAITPNGTKTPVIPGLFTGAKFVQSQEAGYILAGYRFGKWMPRYTFASANSGNGFSAGSTVSHTVGVNYQANSNVTAKLEYEYDKFSTAQTSPNVTQTTTSTATSTSAVFAGADFMF